MSQMPLTFSLSEVVKQWFGLANSNTFEQIIYLMSPINITELAVKILGPLNMFYSATNVLSFHFSMAYLASSLSNILISVTYFVKLYILMVLKFNLLLSQFIWAARIVMCIKRTVNNLLFSNTCTVPTHLPPADIRISEHSLF